MSRPAGAVRSPQSTGRTGDKDPDRDHSRRHPRHGAPHRLAGRQDAGAGDGGDSARAGGRRLPACHGRAPGRGRLRGRGAGSVPPVRCAARRHGQDEDAEGRRGRGRCRGHGRVAAQPPGGGPRAARHHRLLHGRACRVPAAAANPHFKAAVAYYGGNIMVPWGEGVPAPFARTAEVRCPLLFHFGAEDGNPSPADMHRLDAELTRHGRPHEFHVYAGAGHAFMNFTNAERYREDAAETSWARTLEFFTRHLRG
ncbi:MAG: dienelactone hydrolase family protein [Desulfobacterales bacterium]|nr:dienelactone hydrolase family protein [Desulfobacterales bacterium]